jgi:septum formation protein
MSNASQFNLPFILASASPARRQLLQIAGLKPQVYPSHFDEDQIVTQDPHELVTILARSKVEVVAAQLTMPALILGCDSVLSLGGEIYGKPQDAKAAFQRWQVMRGQTGALLTGHALLDTHLHQSLVRVQTTLVSFADVSDAEIEAYVATGEPLQCAGGFALDGRGGLFVERIQGCHSNVIGLSLPMLRKMLTDLGYQIKDFW